ncbi:MAG: hypothetical protein Q8J60_01330, partial [Thiobacillus sp.]|nr:hypothetical protein [Thiobacillus sp.]
MDFLSLPLEMQDKSNRHQTRKKITALLVALLLLCLPMAGLAAEVRIGILAWFGEETARKQWQPLGTTLQRLLPVEKVSLRYFDMVGLEA